MIVAVAHASGDGFLGTGEKVSPDERACILEINAELELDRTDAGAWLMGASASDAGTAGEVPTDALSRPPAPCPRDRGAPVRIVGTISAPATMIHRGLLDTLLDKSDLRPILWSREIFQTNPRTTEMPILMAFSAAPIGRQGGERKCRAPFRSEEGGAASGGLGELRGEAPER